jgi:hypothetical protein
MNYIIIALCFLGIWLMLTSNGYKRLFWFLCTLFFLPPGVILAGKNLSWITDLMLLGFLFSTTNWLKAFNKFPLKKSYIYFFISMVVIGLFDSRLSVYNKFSRPFDFILENSVLSMVVFVVLDAETNYTKFYRRLIFLVVIFIFYGFFSVVTKLNPYNTFVAQAYDLRDFSYDYMHSEDGRFRISSIFFHPFLYSIVLYFTLCFLLFYSEFSKIIGIKKNLLYAFIALIFISIILTDSRTVLLISLVSVVLYYFVLNAKVTRVITAILFFPVFTVLILQIPQVSQVTDKLTDVFVTGGKNTEGSNVDMRNQQLLITYKYFLDNPLTGNGFNYIYEDIGFSSKKEKSRSDEDAYGFESYFFNLMIEQGLVGIIAHIVLFYSLISYHITTLKKTIGRNRKFVSVNLIIIIGYIVFILATGALNSMAIFFVLMGISLSFQQKIRQEAIKGKSAVLPV